MLVLRAIVAVSQATFMTRADLMVENLALRQQLAVLCRKSGRPRLRRKDCVFYSALSPSKIDPPNRDEILVPDLLSLALWNMGNWTCFRPMEFFVGTPCLILAGVIPLEASAASFPAQSMVEIRRFPGSTFGGPLQRYAV